MTSAFTRWIPNALPEDSDVTVVDNAGHFLQLDEPDKVADLVLGFIGSAKLGGHLRASRESRLSTIGGTLSHAVNRSASVLSPRLRY